MFHKGDVDLSFHESEFAIFVTHTYFWKQQTMLKPPTVTPKLGGQEWDFTSASILQASSLVLRGYQIWRYTIFIVQLCQSALYGCIVQMDTSDEFKERTTAAMITIISRMEKNQLSICYLSFRRSNIRGKLIRDIFCLKLYFTVCDSW
jgi:hypothetical protein